jgi:hypothetical protein
LGFVGLFFRKIRSDPELREHGLPGKATVTALKLLGGTREIRLSRRKAEELLRGEASVTRAKVELSIQLDDGRPAYASKAKLNVPLPIWGRLGVGAVLPVRVDPDDLERFEVDWEGEIAEPTLEQRAAGDPLLESLLERRREPPDEPP